jgi:homoserine dehydrogenase
MINVGILGYGVVGSGVAEVIKTNSSSITARSGEEIVVKKILDIRDFTDSPDQNVLTKNSDDIFNDDSISIVVETIGGVKIAYEFTKKALSKGKNVVTSNKELVATYGPELLKLAKDNNVNYLFEASVGGGIPIIRPLNQCLAANELIGITGILNGTTNYILTQMKKEGKNFSEALKEAQINGYAEADPTADIKGHDACRKIAILSSIAYNEFVDYKEIHTEGIAEITLADFKYAEAMNSTIKLIGISKKIDDKIFARVSPVLINKSNPLSNVEDVFNAIVVKGNAIGDAMFYGRGAGKLPTASAAVADIIDIAKHSGSCSGTLWEVKDLSNMIDFMDSETKVFVRISVRDSDKAKKLISTVFNKVTYIKAVSEIEDEIAFITELNTERFLQSGIERLKSDDAINEVVSVIRILEEGL